jgi:DNA-binding transcriptional LysR family regulator
MAIDPRQLSHFLAIAEHGSFNRAAAFQRISQPALSVSIAQLERQLGVRLLDRGPQGTTLNHFGTLLLRHARALEAVLSDAAEEIELHKRGIEGPLVIGGSPIAMVGLVPVALGQFDHSLGRVSASLVEGVEEELLDLLRTDSLDLVVCTVGLDAVAADVEEEALLRIRLDVVVRPDSPYAECLEISLRDLRGARWAMPPRGGVFRRQVEAVFMSAGEQFPSATLVCGSMMSVKAVVGQTDCVALLPREAVALECQAGALRTIPLIDPPADRFLGIRRRRNRVPSPLTVRFVDALRVAAEIIGAPAEPPGDL